MAEAGVCGSRPGRRGLRLAVAGLIALVCFAALAAGSAEAASPGRSQVNPKRPLPIPGAFQLSASNGYSLFVLALPSREEGPGSIYIYVEGKHEGVRYAAPATLTETSIQANLGALGEISVTFQRSNQAATGRCGHETVSFDSGRYEGKIVFHGEEGYTDVEATSVAGNVNPWLAEICGEYLGSGGGGWTSRPGAELWLRNPALGPELTVVKNRPGAPALIQAYDREFVDGISILRFASLRMPAGRFSFDRRLRTATLRPPAPFAGAAKYDRGKKAGKRWSGDLTVDLPGRPDVPLTGSALRATLVPAG